MCPREEAGWRCKGRTCVHPEEDKQGLGLVIVVAALVALVVLGGALYSLTSMLHEVIGNIYEHHGLLKQQEEL